MRLVQLRHGAERRVAMVDEPQLIPLREIKTVYELAWRAIAENGRLSDLVERHLGDERLDYETIYQGRGDWKLLPPIDHPGDAFCLVSGTGLTHHGSARERQSMHLSPSDAETDSMKMFRWGVEAGRPVQGEMGVAPEWFYKGDGSIVRAHGEPLHIPEFADDGGEEAEMAAIYLIGPEGQPYRLGMAPGNEFADHRFEKKNYLNLAGSKLRECALGPEISVHPEFRTVSGSVAIEREGTVLWQQAIATGEDEMCHSLANLEHHHFKFPLHRRAGDLHIHFLGAHSLSFGQGIVLRDGDAMLVQFEGFGRPLRNPVAVSTVPSRPVEVQPLV